MSDVVIPAALALLPRLGLGTAIRRYRQPLAYPAVDRRPSDGPPIFIVGCPGSGTAELGAMLDRHSRIACAGETWYLANFLEQLRMHYWKRGLKALGVWGEEAAVNIRGAALWYYEQYLARAQKARWADSTSIYVDYLRQLDAVFEQNLRIVHVLRHGLDAVDWMKDHTWHSIPDLPTDSTPLRRLERAATTWIRSTEGVRKFQSERPGLCHTVRYEALLAKPEEVLREVLSFVGEAWEDAVLADSPPRHASGGYRSWPSGHLEAIGPLLAPHLSSHGYHLQ